MTEQQQRDAARGRWRDLSLAEQFGNIGSEISRAIRWSTKNPENAQAALYRALELFDFMLDDPQHRGRSRVCAKSRVRGRWWSIFSPGRTSTAQPPRPCRSTSIISSSRRAGSPRLQPVSFSRHAARRSFAALEASSQGLVSRRCARQARLRADLADDITEPLVDVVTL